MAGSNSNRPANDQYSSFPLPPSPRLSDPAPDLVDVSLNTPDSSPQKSVEVKVEEPPRSASSTESTPQHGQITALRRKRRSKKRQFINMRLRNFEKLFDPEQIYFGCVAPLGSRSLDVHCNELEKLDLHYCCGLFMKVDRSFVINTILSTEFITSLKKIILKREAQSKAFVAAQSNPSNDVELKTDVAKKSKLARTKTPKKFMAFHPRDHWEFAKDLDHKNAVIFVHGHNYAPNDSSAAEFVLNECLAFYADLPYLVVPFIWPCEGNLVDYDASGLIAEEYIAAELATFIRRLWTLFERIDFVGHGKGGNILLRAMKLLKTEKPDVIDMSHLVLIAANMDSTVFSEHYVDDIYMFVKRITIYVNTWDWKLYSEKWWNWSSERVGAKLMGGNGKFDCIDVTQLALSKVGGVDPKYRNYVLPVYESTTSETGLLQNYVAYHELVDKPYMKVVPDKKQNVNKNKQAVLEEVKEEESEQLQDDNAGAYCEEEMKEEVNQEELDLAQNLMIIRENLRSMGYENLDGDDPENAEMDSVEVR